jgi:pimeloyl-ACP methyl ester carboxylesterase
VGFGVSLGMYLSVTCSESVPLISEHEIIRETQGTFLGEYRTRRHQQACSGWPRGEVSPEYYQPAKSEVPVLMLSGEIDPATPPEYGKGASQFLLNSRQIVLRRTPHDYQFDCATQLAAEFIAKGSARDLNTSCAEGIRRPRFLTELPERYNR